ncbi:3-oxo-5-alpha-steroid 4-dehydrogenase [soil metagenome]
MNYETYKKILFGWMAIAVGVFFLLLKVTAPYGRHSSSKWGPQISNKIGWVLMEAPVMILLLYYVIRYAENQTAVSYTLVAAFMFHYINRTFIFPFRIRTKGKKMPILIVCSGICFNIVNGFSLGYYFAHFAAYSNNFFYSPAFIVGIIFFLTGIFINWKADNMLIALRKPGDTGYTIPAGWLFNSISCPNLFGEIVEWSGYAIMCWNLPAASFLVWTAANLIPRALSHHKWYKKQFEDYPPQRNAVFPFLL